jgi:predicted RNA-binding protein associated with RNAse of E/G family
MVQHPGDHHAVWHFWSGPAREFAGWYINLQVDFVRTAQGYDTQDLELDIVVQPDGRWALKDQDALADRVVEGRFSQEMVTWIESIGAELVAELRAGRQWWDPRWARWQPDPSWRDPRLTGGWNATGQVAAQPPGRG